MQRWPETFRYVGVNFLECDDWFNGHGEMTSDAEYYDFEPVGRRTCVYINVVRKNDKKSSIANEEEKMERGREGVSVCVYLCAGTFRSETNRMVAAAETCRDNYCTPVYCTHFARFYYNIKSRQSRLFLFPPCRVASNHCHVMQDEGKDHADTIACRHARQLPVVCGQALCLPRILSLEQGE